LIGGIWPVPKVERLEALSGEPPVDPIRFFGKIISIPPRVRSCRIWGPSSVERAILV
jgi:hypothetical protein